MDYKEKVIALLKSQELSKEQKEKLQDIFPELKESEDERTRKGLVAHLKDLREWEVGKCVPIKTSGHYDAWLAWLEKQKERSHLSKDEEQKSAWSEEDETALGDALWCCKQAASIAKDENDMGNAWYAENWLKSLKDRVQPQSQWKPSDKQIMALRWVLNHIPYNSHKEEISGLLEQLKK